MIAVLCAATNSEYKNIPDLDCYDMQRNARTFVGPDPVICHPPCRGWTSFGRNMAAAPRPGEMDLAYFCIENVIRNGGVLEHPYHSLFAKMFEGHEKLKTVLIDQAHFGYKLRKRTRLLMPKDWAVPEIPFELLPQSNTATRDWENGPKWYRAYTTKEFAEWLVQLVRINAPQD